MIEANAEQNRQLRVLSMIYIQKAIHPEVDILPVKEAVTRSLEKGIRKYDMIMNT